MRAITTEIAIAAPAELVWQVFTDFPGHASWNPYVRTWEGEARTLFRQHEEFRGLLVPFIWNILDRDARAGFEAMNQALRDVVEARHRGADQSAPDSAA